jgi:hypothetical protein
MLKPSLRINFAKTKMVDPRIQYSRNSTATYVGHDGLIRTAAVNEPRFTHHPETLESLGLMVEGTSTMYMQNSGTVDEIPGVSGGFQYGHAGISPSGHNDACIFFDDTTTATHFVSRTFTNLVANETNAYSCFVKFGGGDSNISVVAGDSTSFGNRLYVILSPTGQVLGSGKGGLDGAVLDYYRVDKYPNGWYRVQIVGKCSDLGANNTLFRLFLTGTDVAAAPNWTGTGKNSWLYWGSLGEKNTTFASSYQPATNTFTSRASTATYYGSDGLLKTAAIDEARMNYNPINLTLEPHLLLEEASTNLAGYSQTIGGTGWTPNGTPTVTQNYAAAPDGTTTATRIQTTIAVEGVYGGNPGAISTNSPYTWSVFVKSTNGNGGNLHLGVNENAFDGLGSDRVFYFNLATGAFTTVTENIFFNHRAQKLPNGWWRISVTFYSGTLGTNCFIALYSADAVNDYLVWGNQLEAGHSSSSYIATTTTAVTRSSDIWTTNDNPLREPDVLYMSGTNFSSWYRNDKGTFLLDFYKEREDAQDVYTFMITDEKASVAKERYQLQITNTWRPRLDMVVGGGTLISVTTFGYGEILKNSDTNRVAYVLEANNRTAVVNKDPGTANTAAIYPTCTMMSIGSKITGDSQFLGGVIKKILFYPNVLTLQQIKNIT